MGDARLLGPDRCSRCGASFADGALRYRIDIRVSADNAGALATVEDLENELGRLIDVLENKKPTGEQDDRETEDVHFVLCKACKEEYMKGPEIPPGTFFFGE